MDARIKSRWVAALRSGEYAQTFGRLHRTSPLPDFPAGFCCLGVLCDLAEQDGIVRGTLLRSGSAAYEGDGDPEGEFAVLPESVRRWAGLPVRNPNVADVGLAEVNDAGTTFSDIADLIEEHL